MADRLLLSNNIPAQFRRVRFAHFDTRIGNPLVVKELENWEPTVKKPSALFVGKPNLGKTMMAAATLNEFQLGIPVPARLSRCDRDYLRQRKWPVYFVQLAELIDMHLGLIRLEHLLDHGKTEVLESYEETHDLLNDLRQRVRMLVIDDVGKEHTTHTGYAQDTFDLLMRTRHNAGLPTILTTNVPLSRWSTHYSESMQSLIRRSSLMVEFH